MGVQPAPLTIIRVRHYELIHVATVTQKTGQRKFCVFVQGKRLPARLRARMKDEG